MRLITTDGPTPDSLRVVSTNDAESVVADHAYHVIYEQGYKKGFIDGRNP